MTGWAGYLAPFADRLIPGTAQQAMYAVDVTEIVAGLFVALRDFVAGALALCRLAGRPSRAAQIASVQPKRVDR